MQIVVRRAEPQDVESIKLLIKDEHTAHTLKKRFGDLNSIAALIDISPLSLVATDQHDTVVIGFCAFSNGPPPFVDAVIDGTLWEYDAESEEKKALAKFGGIAKENWEKWLRERYESKDISIHNAKFLAYFISFPDHQIPFLDAALSSVFNLLPSIRHICYLLPDVLTPFAPLNSQKFIPQPETPPPEDPTATAPPTADSTKDAENASKKLKKLASKKRGAGAAGTSTTSNDANNLPVYFTELSSKTGQAFAPFALQVCTKKDVFPPTKIRKGRVEDCDDLVPLFRKQHLLPNDPNLDHTLAELLESTSEHTRTLVAQVGPIVTGFMSLSNEVDQKLLADTFDLDAFDGLIKDVPPEVWATANGEYVKPIPVGPEGVLMDPHTLVANFSAIHTADPIRAALEANSAEGRAAAKAAALIAAQEGAQEMVKEVQAQCNAFCVNLLCMEDAHANQGIEFVKAAFALFPDRDYCVITVPTGLPEIPMLRSFTMCQPRFGKMTSHVLYILNRFGCTETISTRPARYAEFPVVEQMVQDLAAEKDILSRFTESFTDSESGVPKYKSFLAEANSQPIGLAILEKLTFASTISDQFDISEFLHLGITPLDDSHVILRHLILNPLFAHRAKWAMEEVMRLAGVSCLMYVMDEGARVDVTTRMVVGREMVPVKRRRQLSYILLFVITYVDGLRDGVSVSQELPYNLQLLTSSLLYEPKLTINSKIVLIGGSDTGLAFLEKLVYSPHLYFSNITLISTAGVPVKASGGGKEGESFVENKLRQLGLDHYVRIIRSSTTEFDRVLKRVRLDNEAFVTYNFLFLTPGVQFFASNISEDFEALNGVYNVTARNHEAYMKACLKLVGREIGQTGKIVVYGRDLQVYVTVQELIKNGIHPSWIVIVVPPLNRPSSCFNNSAVEEKVVAQVQALGVEILFDYKVSQWESSPTASLTSVTLVNKSDKTEETLPQVECFLYADQRSVDPDAFMSINDSCLVFDGRLVIDKYFRTQDPYIYAAGSVTKYGSKYQTKWTHEYFDSKEVGVKLAETVMPFFDPISNPSHVNDNTKLLPFAEAKKVVAQLPGGLLFCHFDEPRLPSHTLEFLQKQANYGRDLVIDTPEYGYFRIRVDPHGFIRSLTYLGVREIPIDNIMCLYGLNERYLNRLVARFDEGVIPDFVSFLSETWAYPIFHDRFPAFIKECRTDMLRHMGEGIQALVAEIKQIGSNGKPIEQLEREELVKIFQASSERQIWDAQLFEFFLESKLGGFLSETWAYPIFHDRFPAFIKECRTDLLRHMGKGIQSLVAEIKQIGSNGKPIEQLEREELVKIFQASSERQIWDAQLFAFFLIV
ncbi:hypothetical protein HDU98_000700 [Podochytrium sp. JEL0797]|nr:hypothetical protein HDU98_000700 [Podochytrium sp. JEL0797]